MSNTKNSERYLQLVLQARDAITSAETTRLLNGLAEELRAEIGRAAMQGTDRADVLKIAQAMLKDGAKSLVCLGYAQTDNDGRQYVCDGYRAFCFSDPLPLPEKPADVKPYAIASIFPNDLKTFMALPLPTAADIKTLIATERAEYNAANADKPRRGREKFRPLWHFGATGEDLPSVNAFYLLDLVRVFPDAKTIYCENAVKPLFVNAAAGRAVLLPIRTDRPHDATQPAAAVVDTAERRAEEYRTPNAETIAAEAAEAEEIARRERHNAECKRAIEAAKAERERAAAAEAATIHREAIAAELSAYKVAAAADPKHSMVPREFVYLVRHLRRAEENEAAAAI